MKTQLLMALFYALMAAIGNALFAYGQKKSSYIDSPFLFLIMILSVCITLFLISNLFTRNIQEITYIKNNYTWALVSGLGFYLTFLGFYFLYTHFGTTYYILYAILSIFTTSIVVGVFILDEKVNIYHMLGLTFGLLAIVFFVFGGRTK